MTSKLPNVLVATLLIGSPLAAAAADRDATVTIKGADLGGGMGYSWGTGGLHYRNQDDPLHIKSFGVTDVGASSTNAVDEVYNLNHVAGFQGKYGVLGAGAGILPGGSDAIGRNEYGVMLQLHSANNGKSTPQPGDK